MDNLLTKIIPMNWFDFFLKSERIYRSFRATMRSGALSMSPLCSYGKEDIGQL